MRLWMRLAISSQSRGGARKKSGWTSLRSSLKVVGSSGKCTVEPSTKPCTTVSICSPIQGRGR